MPLSITKIAFGAKSLDEVKSWFEGADERPEMVLTTRNLPRRQEEMVGGSLYWLWGNMIVGRSPLIGFREAEDGRWHIVLERRFIEVQQKAKYNHQGWRYLAEEDAPADLRDGENTSQALPAHIALNLARLGLD